MTVDRLGRAHRGGVADGQVALLGGGLVDDDLARRLGRPALGQVVGVEARRRRSSCRRWVGGPLPPSGSPSAPTMRPVPSIAGLGRGDAVDGGDARRRGRASIRPRSAKSASPTSVLGADEGVGAGVGLGEHVAEAVGHGVAEHQRARQEGHAEQHGGAGAEQAPLVGAERLEGGPPHGDQPPKPFMLLEHALGGRVGHRVDDPAVGQEHDGVGVGGGDGVVGDHHDGLAHVVDGPPHEAEDLGAAARVEVAGGLVGEDHLGPAGQRPGHGHPLLLAARQLGRAVLQPVAAGRRCRSPGRASRGRASGRPGRAAG